MFVVFCRIRPSVTDSYNLKWFRKLFLIKRQENVTFSSRSIVTVLKTIEKIEYKLSRKRVRYFLFL